MSQRSWVYINWLCMHFDAVDFIILCSHSIIFVSFRISNETMAGCTWNPNIVHQNKVNWFGHDQDLIYPWVERIKWSAVWQFGLTFLFWVILLICSVLECVWVPYLHMLGILKIRCKYNEGNNIIEFFLSLYHDSIKNTIRRDSLHVSMTMHLNMYWTSCYGALK